MKLIELRDEDIRKYIDLFMKEEVENGRDPTKLILKNTIQVYKRFNHLPFSAHFHPRVDDAKLRMLPSIQNPTL